MVDLNDPGQEFIQNRRCELIVIKRLRFTVSFKSVETHFQDSRC